jgi:peptidoglycan hydrolase-like protein with peptidoglycan-binding domain
MGEVKMKKKFLSLFLALGVISTPLFTNTLAYANETNVNSKQKINDDIKNVKVGTISGITYTYKNAPESVKKEYLENAKNLNLPINDESPIFIPDSSISKHKLSSSQLKIAAVENWSIGDYGSYFFAYNNYGSSYTVYKSTLVGYNHNTSGNAVHLTQLFLNIFAYKYPGHNSVSVDSIFGPQTHSAILSFQQFAGLSQDATVGPNTWNTFSYYCLS